MTLSSLTSGTSMHLGIHNRYVLPVLWTRLEACGQVASLGRSYPTAIYHHFDPSHLCSSELPPIPSFVDVTAVNQHWGEWVRMTEPHHVHTHFSGDHLRVLLNLATLVLQLTWGIGTPWNMHGDPILHIKARPDVHSSIQSKRIKDIPTVDALGYMWLFTQGRYKPSSPHKFEPFARIGRLSKYSCKFKIIAWSC